MCCAAGDRLAGSCGGGTITYIKGVIKTETAGTAHVNANGFIHCDLPTSSANQVPKFGQTDERGEFLLLYVIAKVVRLWVMVFVFRFLEREEEGET